MKRIKNCYTVSAGLADYFKEKYGTTFEVIRNMPLLDETIGPASNAETEKYLSEETRRFIFYQGALNEGRGLEHLVEAMQHIPCKLKLAGEGDLSNTLRDMVAEKGLEDKVKFLGMKKPGELKQLTLQSFIGINLLENRGLSYYYSLANKFFDYVQAGVPIITMNFPEYRKLNAEYEVAHLLNDLQTDTLTNVILQLSQDKDAYFRLRENGLRARHDWNWQKEEQKLLAFYQQLA